MTALKNSLLNLIQTVGNVRRKQKLAQLERDFRAIVERTQRERKPAVVAEVASKLQHTINDVERRINDRPADRSVILYDLSRKNRAARDRADQVTFTAVTLAIISQRARELELLLGSDDTRADSVSRQLQILVEESETIEASDLNRNGQQ